ncbi:MAG: metal-dependent hydrolase [Anaerolineae bacterium]
MIIGHLAISILEHRYLNAQLGPVLVGGLFPDLLDKSLCHLLHITPSGRMYAHTVVGLLASTITVRVATDRSTARSWALGYAGHLVADSGGRLPWWYPFQSYAFEPSPHIDEILKRFLHDRRELALELVLLLWAVIALATASGSSDRRLRTAREHRP